MKIRTVVAGAGMPYDNTVLTYAQARITHAAGAKEGGSTGVPGTQQQQPQPPDQEQDTDGQEEEQEAGGEGGAGPSTTGRRRAARAAAARRISAIALAGARTL